MKEIKGQFEVKATPVEANAVAKELGLMQMKFEKKFEGLLQATGLVSMMGMMNQEKGSGGSVALKKITGEVESKKGSFFLKHSATMAQRKPHQSIAVVPDSGTGDLAGI